MKPATAPINVNQVPGWTNTAYVSDWSDLPRPSLLGRLRSWLYWRLPSWFINWDFRRAGVGIINAIRRCEREDKRARRWAWCLAHVGRLGRW